MSRRVETTDYHFKDKTKEEIVEEINKDYPMNLNFNKDYVDRIYDKYPYASKVEIAQIVLATFYCFRELLILGKTINLRHIFPKTKMLFALVHLPYNAKVKGQTPALYIRTKTTRYFRNKTNHPEKKRYVHVWNLLRKKK